MRPSPDLPYSPGSLESDRAARATAREFARLVGRIVNTTICEAPVSFVEVETEDPVGFIAHCAHKFLPVAMPLSNGHFFYLFQRLGLRREERYLTTLEYRYVYQATADPESWIFRYEYQREPDDGYPYPLCHLHLNATPGQYSGAKDFARLHLPCGDRVTIESVVRHLVREHEITPISAAWEEELAGAEAAFAEIQRRRVTT